MNVGDFGNTYLFGTGLNGAGFDMSSYTNLILTFTPPLNAPGAFTVEYPDVSLGNVDIDVPGGVFEANQYVVYHFADGDITVPGRWTAKLTYVNAGASPEQNFNSNLGNFVVGI